MRIKVTALCVLTIIFAAAVLSRRGNASLMKIFCLVSSAAAAGEISRLTSRTSTPRAVAASAVGSALVFGLLGFLAVVTTPFSDDGEATIVQAVYISVCAAAFFGILGGALGLLFAAAARLLRRMSR
jgi:hypothetical protein